MGVTDFLLTLGSAWDSGIRGLAKRMGGKNFQLLLQCIAELWGTALIVIFGVGMVNSAVFAESSVGIWQVAVVWAIGVALAIYTTASISGAHLNPAVSLAFALVRPKDFAFFKLPFFVLAQLLGGMLGAAINLAIYGALIDNFERINDIDRGDRNSVMSALAFGEYFPNPGFTQQPFERPDTSGNIFESNGLVVAGGALGVEAWGTFLLCFVVFALTHPKTSIFGPENHRPLVPAIIGGLIGVMLSLYAPITQAGWNPARDFGPRLVALFAGWGRIAIPGPRDGFWIYIVGPLIGGPLGAAFNDLILAYGLDCASLLESDGADDASCKRTWKEGNVKSIKLSSSPKTEAVADPTGAEGPVVISSLRVISSAELTAGKLSKYVDGVMSTSNVDDTEHNSFHMCQFFKISPNDLVETAKMDNQGDTITDRVLKPVAEVECAIDSCSIPSTLVAMTSSGLVASASNKSPENADASFLVLHVSVKA